MFQGKFTRKAIAATLLVILSTETIAPSVSYALTSGPTAPEATSFEPIDTTDMVNLQTGDLTYNIPLMEVPGPDGGYPLSLSYHAGIQPNEDASWAGLGWTLNPGAINRNVNGYPDDWYNPTTTNRTYWTGGTTTTFNVGVSMGLGAKAGVTAGLSFSNDTYRGFGCGIDVGVGFGLGNSPFGASVGIGVSPYGSVSATGGIKAFTHVAKNINASLGLSLETNFSSLNAKASGGVSYSQGRDWKWRSISLVGGSMSTSGSKPSFSVGGITSSVSNQNANNISSSSRGLNVDIPTPWGFSVSLGYNKTRYWTDESVGIPTHGSLQTFGWDPPSSIVVQDANNAAYDEYSLLEDPSYKNIIDYPDPKAVQGGSFPDFDVYSVSAQGLGGNMRPFLFKGEILNQNIKLSSTQGFISYFAPKTSYFQPSFRFENDFSNSYRQNYNPYSNPASLDVYIGQQPFDPSPQFGNNDGNFGFNGAALSGSKYVYVGIKVRPNQALGYTGPRYVDGVEGFSITNESGVTYHYGLPAYSWGEENYQEKIDRTAAGGGFAFTRQTKAAAYAYTWYLTSVTGSDFVDRNGNGKADATDWGYWVNFDYGKWSDDYVWRNPSEGFRKDEDQKWQNCSIGHKEVYYLNAVRTRTHTAIFEKDLRLDGKGASPQCFNTNGGLDYNNAGRYNANSSQSLKLSKIYLLNAADENFVLPSSGSGSSYIPTRTVVVTGAELPNNVLDKNDVNSVGRAALEAKAIRIIDFNSDYSLCPKTTNSFNSFDYPSGTDLINYNGKLTLNSLQMRGKGGVALMPATNFNYELSGSDIKTGAATFTDIGSVANQTIFTFTSTTNFATGDLINISTSSQNPWIIRSNPSANTFTTSFVRNTETETLATPGASSGTVTATKNPAYKSNAYDVWGMFKGDYDPAIAKTNENLGRLTTVLSSKNTDVWSLRTIGTSLGGEIKIQYESKDYKKPVLNDRYSLVANSITRPAGFNNRLKINLDNTSGIVLSDYLTVGTPASLLIGLQSINPQSVVDQNGLGCSWYSILFINDVFDSKVSPNITNIVEVGLDYIVVENADFNAYFQTPVSVFNSLGQQYTVTCQTNKKPACANVRVAGNVTNFLGGGIRVKQLSTAISGVTYTAKYDYRDPATNLSSGVISYEPFTFEQNNYFGNNNNPEGIKAYKKVLYKDMNNLLAISRDVPAPGVMYEYVKITNEVKNSDESSARAIEGAAQYQFEVFRSNMVGRIDQPVTGANTVAPGRTSASVFNGNYYTTIKTHNLALMRFTSAIGNIKRIIQFDNTGKKLSETINNYLHDGLEGLSVSDFMTQYKARLSQFGYQGYIQERYSELKSLVNQPVSTDNVVQATLSARETFPAIQTGQTTINYLNGTTASAKNIEFDYYSGAVTKVVETDAYGNSFLTQTIPAYRKYPVMGLKIDGNSNATKNMLSQEAESYSYAVDLNNVKTGLVSAEVTTWSNQVPSIGIDGTSYLQNTALNGDVWRMQASYKWMPDAQTTNGLTAIPSFTDFNFTTPSATVSSWKKTSEITLYDVFSKALESKDINNNISAARMDYGNKKVVFAGSPANYYEIAYSGAEDGSLTQINDLFVKAADGIVSTGAGMAHTGAKSLLLGVSGKKGFSYTVSTNNLVASRDYTASVWVKPFSGSISDVKLYYDINGVIKGTSVSSGAAGVKTAGGWYLIDLSIKGTDITAGNTLNVWCRNDNTTVQAYVDDMRFQPLNASTTAYVYDSFSGELSYVLGNNNLYTRYEYDAIGRLLRTYNEKLNIGEFKTVEYQYNSTPVYSNNPISQNYTKNDCAGGQQIPPAILVNIAAGTYTSTISQPDADAKAQQAAQNQANSQGVCKIPVTISVTNAASIVVIFKQGATNVFSSTYGVGTYTVNLPVGSYDVQVIQTNNVSHSVSLTNAYSTSGVNITYTNISFVNAATLSIF